MDVKVRLYGKLRQLAPRSDSASGTIGIAEMKDSDVNTISDVLQVLGIGKDEVSHIFLNGEYSSRGEVKDGDRLGIFPRDMGLLYKWYFGRIG